MLLNAKPICCDLTSALLAPLEGDGFGGSRQWRERERYCHRAEAYAEGANIEPTILAETVEHPANGPKAMPMLEVIVAAPNTVPVMCGPKYSRASTA